MVSKVRLFKLRVRINREKQYNTKPQPIEPKVQKLLHGTVIDCMAIFLHFFILLGAGPSYLTDIVRLGLVGAVGARIYVRSSSS